MYSANKRTRSAFAIFQNTLCEGIGPTWREDNGFPVIYSTEREAQIEIAEMLIGQLRQFVIGFPASEVPDQAKLGYSASSLNYSPHAQVSLPRP